ncbi:MAG: 3-oxoadipate enol-lactonase [Planctomycetota bacterium]|jgi:3-oxoadipate enol-lactonase
MRSVEYYQNGDLKLAYSKEGSGPVVIFMHGIGGNRSNWDEQQTALSNHYCTIAWDARGYGESSDPVQPLEFSDFADDLNALLDHLDVKLAHLVGLSMGGMIAQEFYGRYPQRVATLTLADSSQGFGAADEAERKDFLSRRLAPLESGLTPADLAPTMIDVLTGPKATDEMRRRLLDSLSAVRTGPYIQALKATVTTDFRNILPKIDVPTLVIVGSEDKVLAPEESELLADAISGAKLETIEHAGHLSNIEAPERFNFILTEFLGRHAALADTM